MAPLPANNTARLWVGYNDGENDHELMVRFFDGDVSNEAAVTFAAGFFDAASAMLYEITITGARIQLAETSVSFPIEWTGDPTYGTDPMPVLLAPRETRWLGRTVEGRKVSWSLYGGKYTSPDDYRLTPTDLAAVGTVLDYLTSIDVEGVFLAIDNHKPIRYQYADVNFNSYWEREQRS